MRRLLYILALLPLFLLLACADDKEVVALLDRAEALMEASPDSASRLLHAADSTIARQSEPTRMRHAVLLAEANNKLYQPLPSDTAFQEVVDYYDRHGSPNQQLLAHYLLGCIHRDRNEAPQALQCYYDAIEKADTLSPDCDYTTLFSVYGQMGELYREQSMPERELQAWEEYRRYAAKAGDTRNIINGLEQMLIPYYVLDDTAKVWSITDTCALLYRKHNLLYEAGGVYPTAILTCLNSGQYERAHQMMQIFEHTPGIFDAQGNIEKGREHYYHSKGLYHLGIHQLDSAELYFRRLLHYGFDYDAYRGLLRVYKAHGIPDSIYHYATLCEEGLGNTLAKNQSEIVLQLSHSYDYTRYQKIAEAKMREAEVMRYTVWGIVILSIMLLTGGCWRYISYKQKKSKEIRLLNSNYLTTAGKLTQAEQELAVVRKSYSNMKEHVLATKEAEIEALHSKMQAYQAKYDAMKTYEREDTLRESDVFTTFKKMTRPTPHPLLPNSTDWKNLLTLTRQCLPMFYQTITQDHVLTEQELRAAILVRLNFSPSEIAILLSTSQARISTVKRHINQKLYGEDDAASLYKNMKKQKIA